MASQAGRESDKFMLRLPDGMREQVRVAAELNGRSMNSEIVARLAESFLEGQQNRQALLGHMASVDAFLKASPSRRDVVVMALLEQADQIRSLSETLRSIVEDNARP